MIFFSGKYILNDGHNDTPIFIDKEDKDLLIKCIGDGKEHLIYELKDMLSKIHDKVNVVSVTIKCGRTNIEIVITSYISRGCTANATLFYSFTSSEIFYNDGYSRNFYYDDDEEIIINYLIKELK